jgi:hypothetical protein
MRAKKRGTPAPQVNSDGTPASIEALGFRKSSRAPAPDANALGLPSVVPVRRGSRVVRMEPVGGSLGAAGGKMALSAAAAKLEEMKAKTAARKNLRQERQKKKEENKQAVNNQSEMFLKTLMNLESQFKQHEAIRAKLNKELGKTSTFLPSLHPLFPSSSSSSSSSSSFSPTSLLPFRSSLNPLLLR